MFIFDNIALKCYLFQITEFLGVPLNFVSEVNASLTSP